MATTEAGLDSAQIINIDSMITDIYDTPDELISPEVREWENRTYGENDIHLVPDTVPQRIDTLSDIPGPMENLAAIIGNYSAYLAPIFNNLASYIDTAIEEFRFRSPSLNLEDYEYITSMLSAMNDLFVRLQEMGRILRPLMEWTNISSVFWQNHPALHASFEIIYNSSELLWDSTNNLAGSSRRIISLLNNIQSELNSRRTERIL